MEGREVRVYPIEELRIQDDGDIRKLLGHAAPFWKLSEDLGGFRERIAKGSFKNAVANGDVYSFWSHRMDQVLGRTKSGSLKIWEDEYGLAFDLNLPDTRHGRDAHTLIKRGDVTGMSFGFVPRKWTWDESDESSVPVRTLLDIELFEISPTVFPAYPQTNVVARSTLADLEEHIRTVAAPPPEPTPVTRTSAQILERLAERDRIHRANRWRATGV